MTSYILKHQSKEGQSLLLDEPVSSEKIMTIVSKLLDNDDTSQILIKKLTPEQLMFRTRKWFIEYLDDEEEVLLSNALFKEKNEDIWPFDLIPTDDVPDESINNYERLAIWLWDVVFNQEQRKHICKLQTRLD
jgi:hypothetical protein